MARKLLVMVPEGQKFFPDLEAHHAGFRRFLPDGKPVELEPVHSLGTYLKELRAGTLLALDEATAKLAGVKVHEPAKADSKKGK